MAKEDIYYYCETQPEYDPEWHWITEQIALGSYPLDPALSELRRQGINAIVSVRWDEPDYDLSQFEASFVAQVEDKEPFPYEMLVEILHFLHVSISAGRKVYVHCFAGISRSAFVVSCYLMLAQGMEFDDAVALVRGIRCVVCPHPALFNTSVLARLLQDRDRILSLDPREVA